MLTHRSWCDEITRVQRDADDTNRLSLTPLRPLAVFTEALFHFFDHTDFPQRLQVLQNHFQRHGTVLC